jgi:hypothetical protein
MSDPRDTTMVPVRYRDLVPVERISAKENSLIVGHLRTVVGHTRVLWVGECGAVRRKDRQQGYNDGDNYPTNTHGGLPDIGPGMDWEKNCRCVQNDF